MDIQQTLDDARILRDEDDLEASQQLLLKLLEEYPDEAQVLFEVGGSYDVMGQEGEAIPHYRRALELGLEGEMLQECLVCLGSSLRYVGEFKAAVETLEEAADKFESNGSGRVFLAMAYYSSGRHEDAVRTLIEVILDTTSDEDILAYEEALTYYKDNLDETSED
jgi:tetratricopeptide (TPR) repeat protein